MKNKLIIFLCSLSLLLTGCAEGETTSSQGGDLSNSGASDSTHAEESAEEVAEPEDSGDDFEAEYNAVAEKYPDKTVLVWSNVTKARYQDEVNEYLAEHGSDYVICFRSFNPAAGLTGESDEAATYAEAVAQAIEDSQQIDIISSGIRYFGMDSFYNIYHNCVVNGWFEPLDDYLENTEHGQELYNLMPENYWQSLTVNGSIYGFDGAGYCLKEEACYIINANLADEQGVDLDNFAGEYDDSIRAIADVCSENGWYFDVNILEQPAVYSDNQFIASMVYIDDNGQAANFFESQPAEDLYNAICYGFDNGVILSAITDEWEEGTQFTKENDFGLTTSSLCGGFINGNSCEKIPDGLGIGNTITTDAYYYYPAVSDMIYSAKSGVGVCSSSQYKDLAFEAICEVMTNRELNNIICYGTDYEIVDGYAVTEEFYVPPLGLESFAVKTPCRDAETIETVDRMKQALEDFELMDYAGFCFDTRPVAQQIIAVDTLMSEICNEFPSSQYATGEDYLADLNARLYDAGLQDIIDEANRQLEVYNNEENS